LKISKFNFYQLLASSAFVTLALSLSNEQSFAQTDAELPPNWKAGGNTREGYYHQENDKRSKRLKQKNKEQTTTPAGQTNSDEAEFEPIATKTRKSTLAVFASAPELLRFDYHRSFSPYLAWTLGVSAPMPIDVEVSMPSDIIKADQSKSIAVAYPAFKINFKVDWGPFVHTGLMWHPFGGGWYNSVTAGIRSISIKGNASSPLRVCSIAEAAKEPPCGNDQAAIQTRNKIALDAEIKLLGPFARVATGWIYNLGPAWAINAELGVLAPFTTKESSSVKASIIAPDGTEEAISGALSELREKSEIDLEKKAKEELGRAANKPLPVLAVGLGYRF